MAVKALCSAMQLVHHLLLKQALGAFSSKQRVVESTSSAFRLYIPVYTMSHDAEGVLCSPLYLTIGWRSFKIPFPPDKVKL